jgi:hypothetical protein
MAASKNQFFLIEKFPEGEDNVPRENNRSVVAT